MNQDITKEENHLLELEKVGFTQEQIDALYSWIEYAKQVVFDYMCDIVIVDLTTNLEKGIREHRHLENGEVTRPY